MKSQYHDIVNYDIVRYLLLELSPRPVINIYTLVINDTLLDYAMVVKVRGQGQITSQAQNDMCVYSACNLGPVTASATAISPIPMFLALDYTMNFTVKSQYHEL